jgi:DNA repair exonuclease SbcCD ATPase subunit
MRINTVRLRNFGPYEDVTHELNQGLVGIVGPNGSGKSTLVNGIYACLTNDFSRFSGVKSDIIRDTATAEAPSFVEVSGSHEGVEFLLRRGLRPNNAKLIIAGEREYKKAADISERLVSDVGLHRKLIDAYVFVDQWEMFEFLSQTDSKRAESFRYLCGTEKSAEIYDACAKFMASSELNVEVVDNSDTLAENIATLSEEIAEEEEKLKGLQARQLSEKSHKGASAVVQGHERRNHLAKKIAESEDNILSFESSWHLREEERVVSDKAMSAACLRTAQTLKSVGAANASKELWNAYNAAVAECTSAVHRLDTHESNKPVLDLSPKVCPTCLQEVKGEHLEAALRKDFEEKLASYEKTHLILTERCTPPNSPTCPSEEELDMMLETASYDERVLKECEVDYGEKMNAVSSVYSRWELEKEAEAAAHLELEQLPPTTDDLYGRAVARLAEHEGLVVEISGVEGRIGAKQEALSGYQTLLDELRAEMERHKSMHKLRDVVGDVREIFHWQNLPKRVAQANLQGITHEINDALDIFGSPFWVEADQNLSFKVHFPASPPRAAGALSGGQKAILAICFRMAINKLFGADVGMMFLDEPTAGLDNDNIEYFREALLALATKVRGKQQVVIITHATELQSTFDQVIEIGV